jgi:chemotaxis protein methyltransferase CheR
VKSELIEISDELFQKFGKVITENYGIKMSSDKKIMFQSRLQKRLRELKISSFDEYASSFFSDASGSNELKVMADLISTNKTDFFREKEHFQFITDRFLPEYLSRNMVTDNQNLKIWSAGCSSGQEAYSIGITLEEYFRRNKPDISYSILATDISERVLKTAKLAIYPDSAVSEIPLELKHRYFLKSKDQTDPKVRVIKELRNKVQLVYLNLMDSSYQNKTKFDVIFLRNTLIYFEPRTQLEVLEKVISELNLGGYLFIGHSESLINLKLPIQSIAPSVYVKIKK